MAERRILSEVEKSSIQHMFATGSAPADIANVYNCSVVQVKKYCKNLDRPGPATKVESENVKQTYRQNLNWALEAAGEYLRTKRRPKKCPNNAAYFLYKQAIDDAKDFMTKVSGFEKGADNDDGSDIKKSTRKSLLEIETFLETLDAEESTITA